jgi:hypothetical protein
MAYVSEHEVPIARAEPLEPTVILRKESRPDGSHLNLWAYLDSAGQLHIDGQDLGPVTCSVSGDGEYEYFKIVAPEHLPRLREVLGLAADADILERLANDWNGARSYELEDILRDSDIPVVLAVYSG